jgi:hypothetical protein
MLEKSIFYVPCQFFTLRKNILEKLRLLMFKIKILEIRFEDPRTAGFVDLGE